MKLTEFRSIFDLLEAFPTETCCIRYLEQLRWPSGPVSPYDPVSVVYNRGNGLYRKRREKISTFVQGLYLKVPKFRFVDGL